MRFVRLLLMIMIVLSMAVPVMADVSINGSTTPAWQNMSYDGTIAMLYSKNIELSQEIIGYDDFWIFKGTSGTIVYDEATSKQNLTVNGSAWNASEGYYQFDGTTGTDIDAGFELGAKSNFTYAVQAKLEPGAVDGSRYAFLWADNDFQWYLRAYVAATADWMMLSIWNPLEVDSLAQTIDIPTTSVNYVSRYDNATLKNYMNGIQQSTVNTSNNTRDQPYNLFIGSSVVGTDQFYKGFMYKIKLFRNVALNTSQIIDVFNFTTSGNLTAWHDSGSGNEVYQVDVNATTPDNTNYTFWYRQNNTGDYVQVGGVYSGNQTIALSPKYQNTDARVVLAGNLTATPELIQVTFWTQAVSAGNPPNITSWSPVILNQYIESFSTQLFSAVANQTIDTWNWYLNSTNQNNDYDNLSYTFNNTGYYILEVNATNTNGTSNTVQWNNTIKQAPEINISVVIT